VKVQLLKEFAAPATISKTPPEDEALEEFKLELVIERD
jgi:hypothetical protein